MLGVAVKSQKLWPPIVRDDRLAPMLQFLQRKEKIPMTMIRVRALSKVGRFNMHGITCETNFIDLNLDLLSAEGLAALKLHRGINLEVAQEDAAAFERYDGSDRDLALYAAQLATLRADKIAAVLVAQEAAHQADHDYQDALDALEAANNKKTVAAAVEIDGVAVDELADDADDEGEYFNTAAALGAAIDEAATTTLSSDADVQSAIADAIAKSGKKNKGK